MTEVVVRDLSSGRYHKRYRSEGHIELASFEGCNADASGAFEIIEEAELADAPQEAKCKRCFAAENVSASLPLTGTTTVLSTTNKSVTV